MTPGDQGLRSTISDFSIDLYLTFCHSTNDLNLILSPLLIQTLLSLLYCGTTPNTAMPIETALFIEDETRSEIANEFFDILTPFHISPYIRMVNSIYLNDKYTFLENFKILASKQFYSNAMELNFSNDTTNDYHQSTFMTVNKFVKENTNNLITNLVKPIWIDKDQELMLINAMVFDGSRWKNDFKNDFKRNVSFYNDLNDCQLTEFSVDLMNVKAKFNYGVIEELNATVIELPYKNSNLSMLIFLPNACGGFAKMEASLDHNFDFHQLNNELYYRMVNVSIPIFSLDYEIPNLIRILSELGLQTLFNPNATEYSHMIEPTSNRNPYLLVNRIVHKTRVFVHQPESKMETNDSTKTDEPLHIPVPIMTMDRSFMFAIRNFETVLLLGRFIRPETYPIIINAR